MTAVGRAMGDEEAKRAEGSGGSTSALLKEHAALLGRVAMALVGDLALATRVLEEVAREAGASSRPDGVKPLVWLLGLLRTASATQLSKLPLRSRSGDTAPMTARMGAREAFAARAELARLRPTEREAVILCLVGGLEADDVAGACNVDLGTAKTRIARGLEQLLVREEEGAR